MTDKTFKDLSKNNESDNNKISKPAISTKIEQPYKWGYFSNEVSSSAELKQFASNNWIYNEPYDDVIRIAVKAVQKKVLPSDIEQKIQAAQQAINDEKNQIEKSNQNKSHKGLCLDVLSSRQSILNGIIAITAKKKTK